MNVSLRLAFATLLFSLVPAVPPLAADAPALGPAEVVGSVEQLGIGLWGGVRDDAGGLWTASYSSRSDLVLRGPDGSSRNLVPGAEDAPSGLSLAPAGDGRVWTAFRNKLPTRGLFVARSDNPTEAHELSGGAMPLARIQMEADGKGGADLLWYDETPVPEAPDQLYWLYFNHLDANGQVGTPERVLPGIYPVWIRDPKGGHAVFSWYRDAKGDKIAVRVRPEGGAFGDEVEVARVPPVSPPMSAFESNGRWFVYWIAQHGPMLNEFLIEGAFSDDRGATWKPFAMDGLRGLDVAAIDTAADGKGRIAFAVTARRLNPGTKPDNFTAYLITSDTNGDTWNDALALRGDEVAYSRAPTAKAAYVGENAGHLLVLWEDWRSIRPEIRYWLSDEQGKGWLVQDAALNLDPTSNYQIGYTDPTIYPLGNRMDLLLEKLGDDLGQRTIVRYSLAVADLLKGGSAEKTPPTPDMERLKTRVNAYGEALVKNDYQGAYSLFDPFYRARVDYLDHLKTQGRIVYTTAEYVDAALRGPIAGVQMRIVASVPAFTGTRGQTIESAERDVIIPVRWLWIDGEWYMEYFSEARDIRYTRY